MTNFAEQFRNENLTICDLINRYDVLLKSNCKKYCDLLNLEYDELYNSIIIWIYEYLMTYSGNMDYYEFHSSVYTLVDRKIISEFCNEYEFIQADDLCCDVDYIGRLHTEYLISIFKKHGRNGNIAIRFIVDDESFREIAATEDISHSRVYEIVNTVVSRVKHRLIGNERYLSLSL